MSHRKETEAMAPQPIEDWARIPWRKLERSVYRLQKRIYQASDRGNDKAVHNLQRLLMRIPGYPYPSGTQGDAE
jgi:RNA-directed DNA polymerase